MTTPLRNTPNPTPLTLLVDGLGFALNSRPYHAGRLGLALNSNPYHAGRLGLALNANPYHAGRQVRFSPKL